MITRTGSYAIRAVTYLADGEAPGRTDGNTTAAEIAQATGIPQNYLTKILHDLTLAGILESTRGPRGGFRLANGAENLPLRDVLAPFEDVPLPGCFLSPGGCSEGAACPSYERCLTVTGQVAQFLRTTRITDLVPGGSR